jgi:hypothetical protein
MGSKNTARAWSFFTGQTGHLIDTRLKNHHQHIWLDLPEKPAMAENSNNLDHCIQLHNTSNLSTKPVDHIVT